VAISTALPLETARPTSCFRHHTKSIIYQPTKFQQTQIARQPSDELLSSSIWLGPFLLDPNSQMVLICVAQNVPNFAKRATQRNWGGQKSWPNFALFTLCVKLRNGRYVCINSLCFS